MTQPTYDVPLLTRDNPEFQAIMGSAPVLVLEKPWDETKLPRKSFLQEVYDINRWALIGTFYFMYGALIQVSFLDHVKWR